MNIDASNLEDINILHITECLLLSCIAFFEDWSSICEGGVDVIGVVTPLIRGGAQVLHGDQVVQLRVQLDVHKREEKGEDGERQIEVESERGELKEKRSWMTMGMK